MGGFGGPWGPPWPPKAPKVKISQFCSLPVGGHVWSILEVKNAEKSDAFFDGFFSGVFVVLGWVLPYMPAILRAREKNVWRRVYCATLYTREARTGV